MQTRRANNKCRRNPMCSSIGHISSPRCRDSLGNACNPKTAPFAHFELPSSFRNGDTQGASHSPTANSCSHSCRQSTMRRPESLRPPSQRMRLKEAQAVARADSRQIHEAPKIPETHKQADSGPRKISVYRGALASVHLRQSCSITLHLEKSPNNQRWRLAHLSFSPTLLVLCV
jgi:hypothetical protein